MKEKKEEESAKTCEKISGRRADEGLLAIRNGACYDETILS